MHHFLTKQYHVFSLYILHMVRTVQYGGGIPCVMMIHSANKGSTANGAPLEMWVYQPTRKHSAQKKKQKMNGETLSEKWINNSKAMFTLTLKSNYQGKLKIYKKYCPWETVQNKHINGQDFLNKVKIMLLQLIIYFFLTRPNVKEKYNGDLSTIVLC